MCGIVGVWNYQTRAPVARDVLQRMTDTLIHRGPDDSGAYFDDAAGLALGIRRLSIIDLSPAGHQPMCNEDGTAWLVFNGEIYNFRELRRVLEARGHAFRSRTDTEVILHHYEERGPDCVGGLNGMFGLGLWDARRARLMLARDRVGKKPLYYLDDGRRFMFASELKALLADPTVPREVDPAALRQYAALGYIAPPRTIFAGIHKLPPAHTLCREAGRLSIQRYWDWRPAFRQADDQTEVDSGAALLATLRTAVHDRLVSDVPLGVFLSGGVDSSAVTGLMAELSSSPVMTFSIGFDAAGYDELPYAREVARRFGTEHHELKVEPEAVRDILPRLVRSFDEPFADSSAVPTYYLSRLTRQSVTVALSGDGGDEALAGYDLHASTLRESRLDWIPAGLRRAALSGPANWLPAGKPGRRLAQRLSRPLADRYAYAVSRMAPEVMRALLRPEVTRGENGSGSELIVEAMHSASDLDVVSRLQYTDLITYLPNDILVKVDRMSMANSLEVRSPFLDHRFLALAARVPRDLRLHGRQGKYVFKRALRGWLPDGVLDRPKKGFSFPVREWFRRSLADFAEEVFTDPATRAASWLVPEEVLRLTRAHHSGQRDHSAVLWSALVLELWQRNFLPPG